MYFFLQLLFNQINFGKLNLIWWLVIRTSISYQFLCFCLWYRQPWWLVQQLEDITKDVWPSKDSVFNILVLISVLRTTALCLALQESTRQACPERFTPHPCPLHGHSSITQVEIQNTYLHIKGANTNLSGILLTATEPGPKQNTGTTSLCCLQDYLFALNPTERGRPKQAWT